MNSKKIKKMWCLVASPQGDDTFCFKGKTVSEIGEELTEFSPNQFDVQIYTVPYKIENKKIIQCGIEIEFENFTEKEKKEILEFLVTHDDYYGRY